MATAPAGPGLSQLIKERKQADLGATPALGRLTSTSTGPTNADARRVRTGISA